MHKANIMKLSDGLFLECFYNVAKDHPEIEADDKIIDNACMQLVMRPEQFDVMVLENLYGDIVSDLCAGLIGGLGLAPGANIGEQGAVFEAVHGSCAGHRRTRNREPDGDHDVGDYYAPAHRRNGRCNPNGKCADGDV